MAASIAYTNSFDVTDAASFIPAVWSDDVIAAYKKNLVLAGLVSMINHKGKKGDTIHIPTPVRGAAAPKAANAVVTLVTASATNTDVVINKHYEYSFVIEDIVETQALSSMRRFYTDDAGYALATQVDTDLVGLAPTWNGGTAYSGAVAGGDGSTTWNPAANTNTGNGSALTDAGIRKVIQTFDDANTPGRDRVLVIPPVEKKRLLGVTRFTEQAFVGEAGSSNSIRNGFVGDLYGVELYVSTNIASFAATDTTTFYRPCLMFQKSSLVLAEQVGLRTQAQYKQEALGTLVTADRLYGVKTLRSTAGVMAIMVPSL